jgi:site-specific DNA-methyltransferase (adenine-specific)
VIIGNPPYQLESSGFGAQATPIYQLFVEQAFRLKPRYVCMITPSRWFSGGMGLDGFRKRMLESKHFRKIVDYPDAAEIFPNVQIKGGVSFFLWDKNYEGKCQVSNVLAGIQGEPHMRDLSEHDDVFIRFNEAVNLVNRIKTLNLGSFEEIISAINPFDLPTNFAGLKNKNWNGAIKVFNRGGSGYVSRKEITKGVELIDKHKLFIPKASDGSGSFPIQVLANPIVGAPGEACTMTYLVVGPFKNSSEAKNASIYLRTKFARFLVAMLKNTQDTSKSKFRFLPQVDLSIEWTDEKLYKFFKVSLEEQSLIESMIKEMPDYK